jgi:hypothetical protein
MVAEVRSERVVLGQLIPDVSQLGVVVSDEQSPSLIKVGEGWNKVFF